MYFLRATCTSINEELSGRAMDNAYPYLHQNLPYHNNFLPTKQCPNMVEAIRFQIFLFHGCCPSPSIIMDRMSVTQAAANILGIHSCVRLSGECINKPGAQAAGANPSRCNFTTRQYSAGLVKVQIILKQWRNVKIL